MILALHISLAAAVAFMPSFSSKKPRFENIYTIDLVQLPAAAPAAQPQPPKPTPAEDKPAPKAISIAKPQPAAPSEAPKPISISPKKKKIKHKIKPKPAPPKKDQSKIIAERKRLAELIRQEALAKQAEEEALRALDEARQLVTSTPTRPTSSANTSTRTGSSSGGNSLTGVEARWFSAVKSHVLDYWALPDLKLWSPNLVATMVITVDRNGRIIDSYVEAPSGDRVFDQFVKKSLQDANPLPPMPAAMKKRKFEIGLNFRPDTIN